MLRFLCILTLLALFAAGVSRAQLQVDTSKFQTARNMERRALATNDSLLLGKAYYLFGDTYNSGGSRTNASNYYLKAVSVLKPLGDSYELGMAYLRVIEALHLTPKSKEDAEYARLALGIFSRLNSSGGMARAYNYLTSTYKRVWIWNKNEINRFKTDKARQDTLFHCLNSIKLYSERANDTVMLAEANLQYGDLYRHLREKRSISYLTEALRLFTQQRNDTAIVQTRCHLASTYMDFGQYAAAYHQLRQARALTDRTQISDYWMISHLYETLTDYYRKTKQWEQALYYGNNLNNLYTYRRAGERDQVVAALSLKHETEQKEAQLRVQNTELARLRIQQRFIVVTSGLLLIMAGLAVFFFKLYRKNQRISRQNEELVKEQNHRVKNNLQVISSLLSLQAAQLTDETARQAVEESQLRIQSMAILHQKLYDSDQLAMVDLNEFIPDLVSGVLETFGQWRVTLQYTIDPIFLSADKAIPLGLILNELVTNACKYAFADNLTPALQISCRRQGRTVQLRVVDNGPGLNALDVPVMQRDSWLTDTNKTFGMSLIQTQVAQLNGMGHFDTEIPNGAVFLMEFNA